MESARVKLSQVQAKTPSLDAERTARHIAKSCDRDSLATLLSETLAARDKALIELQDAETRVFVTARAAELRSYRA